MRFNNEFESKDRTVEGNTSIPVNEWLGLAVQASEMKDGWIDDSAVGDGACTTRGFALAGRVTDKFNYNINTNLPV